MERITFEFATKDDCLDKMVPSDLRVLIGQRDRAEATIEQQAEDIESLKGLLDLQGVIVEEQRQRIEELETTIREAYEVYAGSDGFTPETAPEAYQQKLISDMVVILTKGLSAPPEDE